MKKTVLQFLYALTALILAASCSKDTDAMYSKQEKYIEDIVSSLITNYPEASVDYPGGIVKVTLAPGQGEALADDGKVRLYYAGFRITSGSISNSNLFVTNLEEMATEAKWTTTNPEAFDELCIDLAEDRLVEGLRTGLKGAKAGDQLVVLFNSKYGFGKKAVGNVPSNSALLYQLWITGVENR
ncbi:MAG: FKBP-type peptidyl-prolyl cis-trans isomerase [Candidatus Cryptobacteroides sp.]